MWFQAEEPPDYPGRFKMVGPEKVPPFSSPVSRRYHRTPTQVGDAAQAVALGERRPFG
jgi:hypothetical protein